MPTPNFLEGALDPEATPDFLKAALDPEDPPEEAPDPGLIAHAAADTSSADAGRALQLAGQTGLDPSYAAENQTQLQGLLDKQKFADALSGRPALAAFAGQSPQHAAAVRDHAHDLGTLEGWLTAVGDSFKADLSADPSIAATYDLRPTGESIGQGVVDLYAAEAMREHMGDGGPLADTAVNLEKYTAEYEAKNPDAGYGQIIGRAAPQMAAYALAGMGGGAVGVGGLMYLQNKGGLARSIQLRQMDQIKRMEMARIDDPSLPEAPMLLTNEEIDKWATAGSAAGAAVLAGLLGPTIRAIPGARDRLSGLSMSLISKAATTTVGQAAVRAILQWGGHSAMGALGMVLQGTINDATAQKAVDGSVDLETLARHAGYALPHALTVAATFGALGPMRDAMADRARLQLAPQERAKLDAMVEKSREFAKQNPDTARELFGMMAEGAKVYIDHAAARHLLPDISLEDLAAAEVANDTVAVPVEEYLAKMADRHEAVKEDIKLSRDGLTMNDARLQSDKMRQALTPEQARVLYGAMTPDEMIGLEKMPVAADMTKDLAKKLGPVEDAQAGIKTGAARPSNVAPPKGDTQQMKLPGDTLITPALHDAMAAEYGGTSAQWAEKLTHELVEALGGEGSLGAISPEEHAARVIEALPIKDISPRYFEAQAKKSIKYIQTAAEEARTGSVAGAKKSSVASVVSLQTHEMARDVNLAKAKKAAEVQEEMQTTLDKLTKQSGDDKLRSKLGLAGKPVLRLFDALAGAVAQKKGWEIGSGWRTAYEEAVQEGHQGQEAVDVANSKMRTALTDALDQIEINRGLFSFNLRAVQGFLDNPRKWGDLRPADARSIHDAVKQLVAQSNDEGRAQRADDKATVDEVYTAVAPELEQNPSKGLPFASGSTIPPYKRFLMGLNEANGVISRVKDNLIQKSPTLAKWIFDPIMQAAYDRDRSILNIAKRMQAAVDAMPADVRNGRTKKVDLSDRLSIPGQRMDALDRTYLWRLARHWMSDGNMERVTSMNGWTKEAVSKILFEDADTKLSVHEWDYLQGVADVHEEDIWPRLKEHMEKYYGISSPKVVGVPFKVELPDGTVKEYKGGYSSLSRDRRGSEGPLPEATKGIQAMWGPGDLPHTPGAAQDRNEGSHYLVDMSWENEAYTMAKTEHWLAFDQPVRSVARLLSHPPLKANMIEYMGQGRYDNVEGWLGASATQMQDVLPKGQKIISKWLGIQRAAAVGGAVLGSMRIAAQAATHPVGMITGGEVNPVWGALQILNSLSPVQLANGNFGVGEAWKFAYDNMQEVQRRADHSLDKLRAGMLATTRDAPTTPAGKLIKFATVAGGVAINGADRFTTTWAANTAYTEAVTPTWMGGKGLEPRSQEAFDYASGRAQDLMPSHDAITRAPVFNNRAVGALLMMQGFKSALYNIVQGKIASSVRDFHMADRWLPSTETDTPSYTGASLRTAAKIGQTAAMLGTFALLAKTISGNAQQEDETKGQFVGRTVLASGADILSVPGASTAAEVLAKLAVGGHVHREDFNMMSAPGTAVNLKILDWLGKVTQENREVDQKMFDTLEMTLYPGGVVPSRPARVGMEHLYKLLMGEEYDPEPEDVAGKFVWTDKQWRSFKRTLSPDED